MEDTNQKHQKLNTLITIISIALPLVVAVLFGIKLELKLPFSVYLLPKINAILNGSSALILIAALVAVKNKNIKLHSKLIYFAMILSLAFLLIYVFYHLISDSTPYRGEYGVIYYPLLLSHIALAALQAPLVLYSFLYGLTGQIERHKKLVKYSYPVWLFVCVSGVVCYLMISPYYQ
jgi:putative membrane protein